MTTDDVSRSLSRAVVLIARSEAASMTKRMKKPIQAADPSVVASLVTARSRNNSTKNSPKYAHAAIQMIRLSLSSLARAQRPNSTESANTRTTRTPMIAEAVVGVIALRSGMGMSVVGVR